MQHNETKLPVNHVPGVEPTTKLVSLPPDYVTYPTVPPPRYNYETEPTWELHEVDSARWEAELDLDDSNQWESEQLQDSDEEEKGNPLSVTRWEVLLVISAFLGLFAVVGFREYTILTNTLESHRWSVRPWTKVECNILEMGVEYRGNCPSTEGPGSLTLRGKFNYGKCKSSKGYTDRTCDMKEEISKVVKAVPDGRLTSNHEIPNFGQDWVDPATVPQPKFKEQKHSEFFDPMNRPLDRRRLNKLRQQRRRLRRGPRRRLIDFNNNRCSNTYLPWKRVSFPQGTKMVKRCAYEFGSRTPSLVERGDDVDSFFESGKDCYVYEENSCIVAMTDLKKVIFAVKRSQQGYKSGSAFLAVLSLALFAFACLSCVKEKFKHTSRSNSHSWYDSQEDTSIPMINPGDVRNISSR